MSSKTRALIRPLTILETETRAMEMIAVGSQAAPAEHPQAPSTVYEAFQRLYDRYGEWPLWKRLFHRYVFLPFNRFCFFRLRLVTPDHLLCQHCGRVTTASGGRLGWLERQGVFSQKWRAEQEAEKYPFGGVEPLAFESAEDACTCEPRSLFPNSTARKKYERRSRQTVPVEVGAMQRLKNALAASDRNGT